MKMLKVIKAGSLRDPDENIRGRVAVCEVPEPELLGPEDVKIKVAYCAICGSDPHNVENLFGWKVPFGLGHEISGVIVEMGERVSDITDLKVGDRVAGNFLNFCGTCYYCKNGQQQFCENIPEGNAGMSEYIIWNANQVYRLPDDLSLKIGCLLEPTSIGVRIADKLDLKVGERVMINGGGPIGLIALQVLKMNGATSVTVSEPVEERRAMALDMGADYVIDPIKTDVYEECMKLTQGRGYDAVVDCSGAWKVLDVLPKLVAKCGKLLFAAQYPPNFEFPLNLNTYCYLNEITVTGFFVSPYTYPRALQILPKMQYDKFKFITFPLEKGVEAFEAQLTAKYTKVLINCNEDLADK